MSSQSDILPSFSHGMYYEHQYFVVTKLCGSKIRKVKFLSTIPGFSSFFQPQYFEVTYMILCEIITITAALCYICTTTVICLCLLWNRRQSQLIVRFHEKKFAGGVSHNTLLLIIYFAWYTTWYDTVIYTKVFQTVKICHKAWWRWSR